MHLRKRGGNVLVHAPAKLNLFFEVLSHRSDGFHEVESVVYPVDLCDTLVLRKREDDRVEFRVSCVPRSRSAGDGVVIGGVPTDSSNLVVRAVDALRREGGYERGADILLIKRIPTEAGLGGGSSDAAAALAAASTAWEMNWSAERLAAIGAELGSDVPLFFYPGASVCRGRGEIVESAPACPVFNFVLIRPPVGLRTAEVYSVCRSGSDRRSLRQFLDALASADLGRTGRSLFNRLESAAVELSPWIERLRRVFDDLDCLGHQMTGSGTCYFGLCRHARHARRVAARLESYGFGRAYAVRGCR